MTANPRTIHLLLLEDNPDDVFLFKMAVKRLGEVQFEITLAERLSEAIQIFGEKPIDLAIADLNLPDSCGLATVRSLMQSAEGVPIIALTGWADPELGTQLVNEGVFGHWSKDRLNGPNLASEILNAIMRAGLMDHDRNSLHLGDA